ncbi:MAG: HDOD domain-containing protein [Rhodoferax sp.]
MAEFSPTSTVRRLASGQADPARASMLGRFELRRILGQGAQSVVWLAFDPRLEREVAIKLMKVGEGASMAAIPQWLQEARHVSRLSHPNIVPVFEADVQDLHPYLVFEYVPGKTLGDLLAAHGAMPAVEAADLMADVLDALALAHEAGVIHRDVKPSNILVDQSGRARIMDFGIAAPVQDSAARNGAAAPAGTPGYMAPEVAQGGAVSAAMDIFSAGMVLAEMLSGEPLVKERDPYQAIYRILNEPLVMRDDLAADVDDTLRGIVSRALARDPAHRHPSVRAFRDELMAWSAKVTGAGGENSSTGHASDVNVTLAFLLRRMRRTKDFPAMSDSVVRIQGIASSDTVSLNSLTTEILRDVALTNKLLRLVNSAHFARGGGNISTVSRAVSLVGFNGIRNMALGLVLLEHMQDKTHANVLKDEYVRCLLAGSIAGELCSMAREREEAFIAAMFQNLGRMLAEFYFPEEAREIRGLLHTSRPPLTEAQAAVQVLGVDYETLALGVGKAWGLPDTIQRCMRKPTGTPPAKPVTDPFERMRWMAAASNDLADVMLHGADPELDQKLDHCGRAHARALGFSAEEMASNIQAGRQKLVELADAMQITALPGSGAARLMQPRHPLAAAPAPGAPAAPATVAMTAAGTAILAAPPEAGQAQEILNAGIQDVTNAMAGAFKIADVLRMILETMVRAMAFERIIFCMRDPKLDCVTGRFGVGPQIEAAAKSFQVALKPGQPDLFAAVCKRGADMLISDARDPRIAGNLPPWYRKAIDAHSFLLLPLQIKDKPFGLIYADRGQNGPMKLPEQELALLRTLRNQAIQAFKQSG